MYFHIHRSTSELTLSLTGSWPPSISLLEACSGPLKRATLAEKRLFWWRHCRSYKASGSEERAISTNFPPFPLNRVHRSLGTSTGGLFRPTGKGEGTTIGGGGERIGTPKNFTWKATLVPPFHIHFDLRWHINIFIATIKLENQNLVR